MITIYSTGRNYTTKETRDPFITFSNWIDLQNWALTVPQKITDKRMVLNNKYFNLRKLRVDSKCQEFFNQIKEEQCKQ